MRRVPALLLATMLAACAAPVDVKVGMPKYKWEGETIPGHYAVTVQTGAWRKDVSAEGFACMGWDFPTDVDGGYATSVQDALAGAFERVTFTAEMTPAEIAEGGYDGAIVVYQGAFETRAEAREEPFWAHSAHASVHLGSVVALIRPTGLIGQASPEGAGTSSGKMTHCNDIGERLARASRSAILGLVDKTLTETRALAARR